MSHYDFYASELSRVLQTAMTDQHAVLKIQVHAGKDQTKWLNINQESLVAIRDFLTQAERTML